MSPGFPLFHVAVRKYKITYLAHSCGSHSISIGQRWSRIWSVDKAWAFESTALHSNPNCHYQLHGQGQMMEPLWHSVFPHWNGHKTVLHSVVVRTKWKRSTEFLAVFLPRRNSVIVRFHSLVIGRENHAVNALNQLQLQCWWLCKDGVQSKHGEREEVQPHRESPQCYAAWKVYSCIGGGESLFKCTSLYFFKVGSTAWNVFLISRELMDQHWCYVCCKEVTAAQNTSIALLPSYTHT